MYITVIIDRSITTNWSGQQNIGIVWKGCWTRRAIEGSKKESEFLKRAISATSVR
jgi:hypothetical protein